jgi:4-hydroxy-3-polyprenylbenzoate decarboxylase
MSKRIVLAMTGASGTAYARRLVEVLLGAGCEVHLTASPSAATVAKQELGLNLNLMDVSVASFGFKSPPIAGTLKYYHFQDFIAPMASGSARSDGMVVCPCSGGTLSAIARGGGENLIHRAAEVHMKERRKLVLVTRETPLSLSHIENMRQCTLGGAVVLPASPGFYSGAKSIDDLVDFVVARVCDQLGVEHKLMRRWGEV